MFFFCSRFEKKKLLSIRQLQEKGYDIVIKERVWRIQYPKKDLIAQVNITTNRMFPLYIRNTTNTIKLKDVAWLWHFHYGHLTLVVSRRCSRKI